ncbi:MAG TPA: methyltransferase domain-containing protein [Bacteroidota bacterium]|jgi:ubiquinone/menaquinone biosynthesis C-methylase UbiE
MAIVLPTKDKAELRRRILAAVQQMYAEVASFPSRGFHFPTGRKACEYVGYPQSELDSIPATALESFAGVGYPFVAEVLHPGKAVLDVGSGSGTDLINAALHVGPEGKAYGVDLTEEMISKARENVAIAGLGNTEVLTGNAESLPLEDSSVDVVTSNGVINLVPDKRLAYREIHRVLKDGGEIQISDIVLAKEISEKSKANPQLWAECIVGALPEEAYLEVIRGAGFEDVKVLSRIDYFDKSDSESTKKAANQFGASSITVYARKK